MRNDLKNRVNNGLNRYKKTRTIKNARGLISYNGWITATERTKDFDKKEFKKYVGIAKSHAKRCQHKIDKERKEFVELGQKFSDKEITKRIIEEMEEWEKEIDNERLNEEWKIINSYEKEIEEFERKIRENNFLKR